jgi:hypothetical protein
MLWRADRDCVYAYRYSDNPAERIVIPREMQARPSGSYSYCLSVTELPRVVVPEPIVIGLHVPTGELARVWSRYREVRDVLGYAVDLARGYEAELPIHVCADQFTCTYSVPQITLPDGRILSCGMRAASAGTCNISS